MMPVGPFFAHSSSVSTGPIILMSSSWQIAMNACSGVIDLAPYSWLFARSSTCLPRACSLHALEEALDDAELDVAFEQRQADVAERLVDDVVVELGDAGQPLASGTESLGEGL